MKKTVYYVHNRIIIRSNNTCVRKGRGVSRGPPLEFFHNRELLLLLFKTVLVVKFDWIDMSER